MTLNKCTFLIAVFAFVSCIQCAVGITHRKVPAEAGWGVGLGGFSEGVNSPYCFISFSGDLVCPFLSVSSVCQLFRISGVHPSFQYIQCMSAFRYIQYVSAFLYIQCLYLVYVLQLYGTSELFSRKTIPLNQVFLFRKGRRLSLPKLVLF